MPRILLVEESPGERSPVRETLVRHGFAVAAAASVADALQSIARDRPDIVLADLAVPGRHSLELVEALHQSHPGVPVVLVTGLGTQAVAAEALRQGAASYIPRRWFEQDFQRTLEGILEITRQATAGGAFGWTGSDMRFVLDTAPENIPRLVGFVRESLRLLDFADEAARLRICVALSEALENALYHGNLEISSELRNDDDLRYAQLVAERRRQPPYSSRKIQVQVSLQPDQVVLTVADEGPGYDVSRLPDPTDPANLENLSGRGIHLIRTFMDEVRFSPRANEVTMLKRAPR